MAKETKFCSNSGAEIDKEAEICPKCGVRVKAPTVKSLGLAAGLSFLIITILMVAPAYATTITIDFEDLNDGDYIGTHYTGLTFSSEARIHEGDYKWPSHSGNNGFGANTPEIRIDFESHVSRVGIWIFTREGATLEAYDNMEILIDSVNVGGFYNSNLEVSASNIAYVILRKVDLRSLGNVYDDLEYDITDAGIPVSTGAGTVYFDTSQATIQDITHLNVQDIPEAPPSDTNLYYGLFRFNIIDVTPGTGVLVTLTFPYNLPAGTTYWKYGATFENPTPHWYEIPCIINGNELFITLTDGGNGDDDLIVNGRIKDDGGPSIPQTSEPIPEFPTLAIPVIIVIGLLFLFGKWK